MERNAFATSSLVTKSGCTFIASQTTNRPIRCRWLLMRRDQLSFNQVSRVGRDRFLFFLSTLRVKSWWRFYHTSQHASAPYYAETVPLGFMKSINRQCPTVGTGKTLLLRDNANAQKAKVTVTFLKKRNLQVWPILPTVQTWLHVTFSCFPHLQSRNFPAFWTSQKECIQSSTHRLSLLKSSESWSR